MTPPDTGTGTGTGRTIDILLATYNGERFLAEQIESVLRQSHAGWTLTVRDDCSTDGTLAVAREHARRHPDRTAVQARPTASGSAQRNFLEMVAASRATSSAGTDHRHRCWCTPTCG